MRYRNDGSMPLNYGDRGPWVEPGGEFDTADYPNIDHAQLESHRLSRFISEVRETQVVAAAAVSRIAQLQEDE